METVRLSNKNPHDTDNNSESVIGLSILVAYYRLRGNISLRT